MKRSHDRDLSQHEGLDVRWTKVVAPRRGGPSSNHDALRVGVEIVDAGVMTYIVQRQDRCYVVAYDGTHPLTGKERRRWHPVGHDRNEAEAIARRVDRDRDRAMRPEATGGQITLYVFLAETWLPRKRREVRATTGYRYGWFVEHYIAPVIGDVPLRRLSAHHLEDLYQQLATTGGRRGDGLAPRRSSRST
jgi:hypothetical protein